MLKEITSSYEIKIPQPEMDPEDLSVIPPWRLRRQPGEDLSGADLENIDYVSQIVKKYESFIQPYENANAIVRVWLETLQKDFKEQYHHNPIHNIQSRIKSLSSIAEKLKRKGLEPSFDCARDHLTDIAGTRVICYYIQDVYTVAELLKRQENTILLRESDYIKEPKPNGYRTYHMILGVSLHQSGEYYPVEVQIRTLAMDFWASMEHQLVYKSELENKEDLAKELKIYADTLQNMEHNMMRFYEEVNLPLKGDF